MELVKRARLSITISVSARVVAAAWRQRRILPTMTSGLCDWRGGDPFLLHVAA